MLGDSSIGGELALAEGDIPATPTLAQSAIAEFAWSLSAVSDFAWQDSAGIADFSWEI